MAFFAIAALFLTARLFGAEHTDSHPVANAVEHAGHGHDHGSAAESVSQSHRYYLKSALPLDDLSGFPNYWICLAR